MLENLFLSNFLTILQFPIFLLFYLFIDLLRKVWSFHLTYMHNIIIQTILYTYNLYRVIFLDM